MHFGRVLRLEGVTVGSGQVTTYCDAVARLEPSDRHDLYWAGRACLLSRQEDLAAYDRAFRHYFGGSDGGMIGLVSGRVPQATIDAPVERPAALPQLRPPGREGPPLGTVASGAEVLRHKRFDECSPAELAELRALMARIRLHPPRRRVRRTVPSARGRNPDLRRTIRRSMRTNGEVLAMSWRARRVRPRRLVLLLDVSGSMAGTSRALLQFSHSTASAIRARTEVFCFGTRLTRVTDELRHRQPDQALTNAADAVVDWEGGTRIGESVGAFVQTWGRRGTARGAVVIICSDGLERGDPAVLAAEMAKLARLSHRIVWVNPLKADPRYQPLAGGMRAALPHVDLLVSGHDLSSLEALAALLPELA